MAKKQPEWPKKHSYSCLPFLYLLVQFCGLEGTSVIIQRFVGYLVVHDIRQSQGAQNPLGPISRGIWMSLREYIKRHVSNTYKLDILSSMYCLDGQLHLRKKYKIIDQVQIFDVLPPVSKWKMGNGNLTSRSFVNFAAEQYF